MYYILCIHIHVGTVVRLCIIILVSSLLCYAALVDIMPCCYAPKISLLASRS